MLRSGLEEARLDDLTAGAIVGYVGSCGGGRGTRMLRLTHLRQFLAHLHEVGDLPAWAPMLASDRFPPIADFFREIGWADELGSGMRNTFKYTGLYSGGTPSFEEGDTFVTTVPLTRSATDVRVGPQAGELSHSRVPTTLDPALLLEVLEFCSEPRSRREIQAFCGYRSAAHFRRRVPKPLLEGGQLVSTIPEKPNSPLQRYVRARA